MARPAADTEEEREVAPRTNPSEGSQRAKPKKRLVFCRANVVAREQGAPKSVAG